MQGHPSYTVQNYTIQPGGVIELSRQADFVICLSSSGTFRVAFDGSPESDFEQGLRVQPGQRFSRLRLRNPGGTVLTIRIALGLGAVVDNRLVLAGPVETKPISPPNLAVPAVVTVGAGAVVEVAAENLERSEVGVRNLSTSDRVWLRDDAQATANGWPLDAKEGLILTTTAAVSIYNPNGSSIDVATFETGHQ